ncbi:LD-carboxypeptidase [marine bacterium AO1-C]|nr:LD-carboxypeptidase [marine bacterium AO1-C]
MIKPAKLQKGDKIATISLSWGGAGELPHRYEVGKKQIQEAFGVEVVETSHALKSADWIYKNPQARVDDLYEALEDSTIKAIFSNIGGEDSVRTLSLIDPKVIQAHPKIFIGFSDTTITHFCFFKAGVVSFYGTSVLTGFAENGGMHAYQVKDIQHNLFSAKPVGRVSPNIDGWTSAFLDWANPENQLIKRPLTPSTGWRFLQGKGVVEGALLGGCLEVMESLKDTKFWVQPAEWKGKIMFIETSEEKMLPHQFRWILRNYAASGILANIAGLIVARPYDNLYHQEYDEVLHTVIREEEGLDQLPVITGMDFGHTAPIFTLPYGVNAQIDCEEQTFSILESGVVD